MDREALQKIYGNIVAKAWADDAFKQRLIADPLTVLKENGVNVPEGVQFNVIESTSESIPIILPPNPPAEETGAESLDQRLAAGNCYMQTM
jgi:hypothetical protein